MRLSIIIPLYNSGHFLSKCLGSLLDQDIDVEDYEILIINDGSTDNSLEVALEYVEKYSNISVHSKTNGGVGSARNKGLMLANGDYIYFIDPDDYLAPNVLNTLLNSADDNTLDILTFISKPTTDVNLYNEPPDIKNLQISDIYSGIDYIANNRYQNEVWWYLIKKQFILETGVKFIEDRWMEDAILTAKLFVKAERMSKLQLDAHRHFIVEGSAMKSKEPAHYLRVIDDNRNAAIVFESLINDLKKVDANTNCIKRLTTRQQSFVFFMMVRMLRSTIKLSRAKEIMEEVSKTNAYPLNSFPGIDYKGISYTVLVSLFNNKNIFYLLFKVFNPILRAKSS